MNMRNSQNGAVLVISLIFLMIMTILSVTMLSTTTMDERMASNSQENSRNLQLADSAIQKMFNDGDASDGIEKALTTHDYYDGSSGKATVQYQLSQYNSGVQSGPGRNANSRVMGEVVSAAGIASATTNRGRFFYMMESTATSPSGLSITVHAGTMRVN